MSAFHLALLLIVLITVGVFGYRYWWQAGEPNVRTITTDGVVHEIQKLARLETVAFSVDTVITAQKDGTWQRLWQDEQKGIFIARGRVLAGVDLSKISAEMVQVNYPDKASENAAPHIMITLPPSEVFEVFLDDIEVYDWQTGLFGVVDNDPKILANAQTAAKSEVLQKACAGDVMNLALVNASEQVQALFALTGASVEVATQGAGACRFGR
ncbi:hypothetical protein B0181_10895 [Moraxella caviae]|uniref:DUF4230 domain-containing protein n=1 Tax=Moraxella caviae TaxID=34060 RepID=A0A1S9ZUP1_9GAMM|nr:hypothetical protein B0181_10895 [Moraxella caviae]